jgi:hypothetical protein
VNRTALIEQLKETQKALEKLLVLLESVERDRFVSHLYQSRRKPARLRNCRKIRQANRALCRLNISDRREHGF